MSDGAETTIRRAVPADAAALRALRLQALREHPRAFLVSEAEEARRDVAAFARLLETRWDADDNQVLVAERDGALLGMCAFAREPFEKARHRVEVWGVYVSHEARGHGVSHALFRETLDRIRALGDVRQAHLGVGVYNEPAKSLYRSFGFETWGTEPATIRVEGADVDEEHMVLHLT